MSSKKTPVVVDGRELALSNLDKVLYAEAEFRKADVLAYYAAIAAVLMPHIEGRAMTLKRYPDGVDGDFFFEKSCPSYRPKWVHTAEVPSERTAGKQVRHCLIDEPAALMWIANLASLELHTSLARADQPQCPTMVAFDLDPGEPATLRDCCKIGLELRATLDELGLEAFPKLSGGKGLHVYVPINQPDATYELSKGFAHAIATVLEDRFPDRVTSTMSKEKRVGKVFVDWSQNSYSKTTCSVYSLRARARPTVSMPVTWDEVAQMARPRGKTPPHEAADVLDRVNKLGDLFAPVLSIQQELPTAAATGR